MKWVAIIAGSLGALVLIIYLALAFYLDNYLKSALEGKVSQSSGGLYHLDIGSLHFNMHQFSLEANTITFSTDTTVYQKRQQANKNPDYYQISTEKLLISHVQVWPLLWGDGVQVPGIVLSDPKIYIHTQPGSKQNQNNRQKPVLLNLHQHINKYIPWLTVDSVAVENAQLRYVLQSGQEKTVWQMQPFSLLLQDVLIDEDSSTDTARLFYTRNITLAADKGVSLTSLPYSCSIQALHVSTAHGTALHHLALTTDTSRMDSAATRLAMHVPAIEIGYLDWRKLVANQGLYIPAIHVNQPEVKINLHSQNSGEPMEKPWLAVHHTVNQLVPWLQIDSVRVDSGSIRIEMPQAAQSKLFAAQNFTLTLNDVHIDSAAARNPDRMLYTKDIALTIPDFVQVISELYTVKASLVNASTRHGVYLEGVTVQTDQEAFQANPEATLYELSVPSLQIDFTEWGALLKDKGLSIPAIRISQPEARVVVSSQQESSGQSQPLHQMLPPFIPWLQIQALTIDNGHITYIQSREKGNITFTVDHLLFKGQDMLISPEAALDTSRFLYMKEIFFEIKDFAKVLRKEHKLYISHLAASTRNGITLQQVQLQTDTTGNNKNSRFFYHIAVPLIHADFTDWQAILENRGIHSSLIRITEPKVVVHTHEASGSTDTLQTQTHFPQKHLLALHQEISPYVPWLQIDAIQLTHGEMRLVRENALGETVFAARNIDLDLDHILIDSAAAQNSNRVFYAQDILLAVRDSLSVTSPQYRFVSDSLLMSTKSGIHASGIQVFPQPGMLDTMRTQPFFKIDVPAFSSTFTAWGNFMQAARVHVPAILIEKPGLEVIAPSHETREQSEQSNKAGLQHLRTVINRFVPRLTIDSVQINSGSFIYTQHPDQRKNLPYAAENIDITIRAVQIDTDISQTNPGLLYAEDIHYQATDFHQLFRDSLYALSAEKIEGSTRSKHLQVINLALYERYPLEEYFRRAGGQRDVIRFDLQKMDVENFQLRKMIEEHTVIAGLIQVERPLLNIYRDRRVLPENLPQQEPVDAFRKMRTYIKLDSIVINNGYISYTEFAKKGKKPGLIYFDKIKATLSNLTNDSTLVSLENPASFRGEALLMGVGKTNITLTTPIFNDSISFEYTGALASMDITALNPMLENMAFIKIESGHLDELNVQARAMHSKATGIMCAFYRDLKIELLSQDPTEKDPLWKDVTTFLANSFLINSKNRRKGYNFTPGFIEVIPEKDKNRLNYFWLTIRSGIYGSIGYKQAKKVIPFL